MITTTQLLTIINQDDNLTIDNLLAKVPEVDFVSYLQTLMIQKNKNRSDLIKATNLNRTYAYQIFNGQKNPHRHKVIQIALALQLNINETNNLLSLSNNGYLYPKVKFDAVILYALKHHLSIMDTNLILDMYQLELL